MNEKDSTYLVHISEAISRLKKYTGKMTKDDFLSNELVQAAVIRELEIIGEATKRLSDDFKRCHADVPWKQIAGMRDKLIHDYFGVDLDAVWETVVKDIPMLRKKLLAIAKKK